MERPAAAAGILAALARPFRASAPIIAHPSVPEGVPADRDGPGTGRLPGMGLQGGRRSEENGTAVPASGRYRSSEENESICDFRWKGRDRNRHFYGDVAIRGCRNRSLDSTS